MKALLVALGLAISTAVAQEHGKSESGHGGEHGDSVTMWKWANFAILAGLAGYGISKGAGAFFRGRTEMIQRALVEAKQVQEEAEARAAAIDARMANLGAEIDALRSEARKEMEAEGERVKADTARLVAKIEERAQQEIDSTVKHARKALRAHAADLALELARKKIEARLTPAAQDQLVNSFVAGLNRPGSAN